MHAAHKYVKRRLLETVNHVCKEGIGNFASMLGVPVIGTGQEPNVSVHLQRHH